MYSTLLAGSNLSVVPNIADTSSNFTTLSNNGMVNVVTSKPLETASNGSLDLGTNYYIFPTNGLSASSNIAFSNLYSTDFTIEAWVYYYNASTTAIPKLIGNMAPETTTDWWRFGVNSTRQLYWWSSTTTLASLVSTQTNQIDLDTWTHIAVSYSSNDKQLTLYKNGVAQSNLIVTNGWTISNASTPFASNTNITNMGTGLGYVCLGSYNTVNEPCYVHDLRFTTGRAYIPTPTVPLQNGPGTRLLLQSLPRAVYNPIYTASNMMIGVGTSNPTTTLEVNGAFEAGTVACRMYTLTGRWPGTSNTNNFGLIPFPEFTTSNTIFQVFGMTQNSNGDWFSWDYSGNTQWSVYHLVHSSNNCIRAYNGGAATINRPFKVTIMSI
jgi:hypothetical protein